MKFSQITKVSLGLLLLSTLNTSFPQDAESEEAATQAQSNQAAPESKTQSPETSASSDGDGKKSPLEPKIPFDFDYFEELMAPIADHEQERLCGLDKVCVTLWKKGKLEIDQSGHVLTGDFNGDGISETAMVLEQNAPDDPEDKSFLIYISQKQGDTRKVLLHSVLPEAKNVIDIFWDDKKKALVIDTGGRISQTETIQSVGGSFYYYSAGKVQKVVVVVEWNPKTQVFDLIVPTNGAKVPKRSSKKSKN